MVNYKITLPRNYSNVIAQKYILTGIKIFIDTILIVAKTINTTQL